MTLPIPDWARKRAEQLWRAAMLSPDPVGTIAEMLAQDRPPEQRQQPQGSPGPTP